MSRLKKILIILGLTIFFLIDELLFIFLGKELEIFNIRFLIFVAIGLIAVALNIFLALLVYRAMKKKPTTGQEGMIGEIGVVISTINNEGQVFVHGEIWQAESDEILHRGEKVIVQKVQGLKLRVKRSIAKPRSEI
jgi:membrane-bound serine protease (ClpP class)